MRCRNASSGEGYFAAKIKIVLSVAVDAASVARAR